MIQSYTNGKLDQRTKLGRKTGKLKTKSKLVTFLPPPGRHSLTPKKVKLRSAVRGSGEGKTHKLMETESVGE